MKTSKVMALVLVIAVTLLCSFPAFAIGSVKKTTSASFQGPNVNYYASARATQYQGVATAGNGTSSSAYVGQSAIVVTVSFFNQGDEPWYLNGVYVSLNDSTSSSRNLTDFEIIGGNLSVTPTATPYIFSIFGGENNSYNGGFVVAPHSNLSVAFRVSAFATSDSGNPQFTLNSISFGNSSNSVGDYPYGLDVDFSPMIDYLESDVVPELLDQGVTLDSILNELQSYSISNFSSGSSSGGRTSFASTTSGSVVSRCYSLLGLPYLYDTSMSLGIDVTGYSNIYAIPYKLIYVIRNSSEDMMVASTPNLSFSYSYNISVPSGYVFLGSQYTIDGDFVNTSYTNNGSTLSFTVIKPSGSYNGVVVPSDGSLYYILDGYLLYGTMSDTYSPFDVTYNSTNIVVPSPSYSVYTTDVIDAIDDVHQQEQQYFSDTNTAIGDTGIQNYQFDQGTSSGMHGIKDDFTAVWNACGSLTNVWIFSLTFSVALSIIRHVRLKHF